MIAPDSDRTPAPYDVLTSRDALLEAAKLNTAALACLHSAEEADEEGDEMVAGDLRAEARLYTQVAQGLSTYADALTRWSTS